MASWDISGALPGAMSSWHGRHVTGTILHDIGELFCCKLLSYMMEAKDQQGPIIGGVWETARKLTMPWMCLCLNEAWKEFHSSRAQKGLTWIVRCLDSRCLPR